MEPHRTDVDGVPTVWAPADGELHAGLVFRVGRADETLARGGITHLVEHLVLHQVERADLHFNGATSPRTTTFYIHGDAEEVTSFFGTVCRSLRDLPTDRMDTERAVLRTEAASRSRGAAEQLLAWRYGPLGYGLSAFSEFGRDELTADDLHTWVATWFTRGNAALWMSGGPPPPELRLDLPDGPRMPLPVASAALPRLPAYFTSRTDGIAVDAIVPRSSASSMYAAVLDRRLYARLRRELGISYDAHAGYEPRDAENATVTALADALPERNAEVCRAVVNILIDLARTEVPMEELATVRAHARRVILNPAGTVPWLAGAADSLLTGLPVRSPDEVWDRVCGVTAAEIAAVGQHVLDTALALVPHGQAIGRAGFVAAPTGSAVAVEGRTYLPAGTPESRRRLVLSDDGLSIVDGLSIATVRYVDCVAMLAWPDGARLLFAPDAVTVQVEPQLWTMPAEVLADIDGAVPADRTVHLPARNPGSIPQPPKPAAKPDTSAALPPAPPPTPRPGLVQRLRRLGSPLALLAVILAAVLVLWLTGWTVAPFAGVAFMAALVRTTVPIRARIRFRRTRR